MNVTGNGSAGGTGNPAGGRQGYRQYAIELKRRIVEETFAPGASVSVVARRHDVNSNLVFEWRKRYREGTLGNGHQASKASTSAHDLVRIGVIEHDGGLRPLPVSGNSSAPAAATPRSKEPPPAEHGSTGIIEIELCNGVKVRVDSGIGEAALRRVLSVAGTLS